MRGPLLLSLIPLVSFTAAQAASPLPWQDSGPLATGEVLVLEPDALRRDSAENARREGLLAVDLSDDWAPFIFSETDGPRTAVKPNAYRATFIALANDRVSPDEILLQSPAGRAGVLATVPASQRSTIPGELSPDERQALEHAQAALSARRTPNFLEVYGMPPTLGVLARRVAEDAVKECYAGVDLEGLRLLDFEIGYHSHEQAQRDYNEAMEDAAQGTGTSDPAASQPTPEAVTSTAPPDPALAARIERTRRGQARLRAVRAVQARLVCEGLLSPEGRYTPGAFDLPTHLALAELEKKNDIFGWGFVSGETRDALLRPPMELHLETLRRVLAERVADAAEIVEDGSVSRGEHPAEFADALGKIHPVPNLINDFVAAALRAMHIETPEDMAGFLSHAVSPIGPTGLRVAFRPPPLPPYSAPVKDLSVEIDRGDVWYDVPFDSSGKPLPQPRKRYPSFTLFVAWREQRIPLVRWRTTIGSWRSELHPDGRVYLRYKNSDVGPRTWRSIVAAPVWLPPDGTPAKDLLTKKVFDRRRGPVTVVNTEVMGPGFASAYGLAMAIHLDTLPDGSLFDNQIRTHGSVDYTSIARRFSHGCHRLVNNRAVRLFDFLLQHRKFRRLGNRVLSRFRRKFEFQGQRYEYEIPTRGYYYDLRPALPVMVQEGRIMGLAREPVAEYVRKPGVDYRPLPADSPIEAQPLLGP